MWERPKVIHPWMLIQVQQQTIADLEGDWFLELGPGQLPQVQAGIDVTEGETNSHENTFRRRRLNS